MSAIIKAKGFEPSLLAFLEPKHVIANNYVVPVRYDGCKLQVQLPRCTVCSSVYESGGKFYFDILTPKASVLMQFIASMGKSIKQHIGSLRDYSMGYEVFNDHVTRLTSSSDNELFYSIRIKVPRIGRQFQCRVTDAAGDAKVVTDIKNGSSVLCIVAVDNYHYMNRTAGFGLNAVSMRLMDGHPTSSTG